MKLVSQVPAGIALVLSLAPLSMPIAEAENASFWRAVEIQAIADATNKPIDQVEIEEARKEAGLPLGAAAKSDGKNFAGAWFDDAGYLHVAYVGAAPSQPVAALQDAGLMVDWVHVDRSYDALSEIRDELIPLQQLELITAVSVSAKKNQVVVGLSKADPDLQDKLVAQYGEAVDFALVPEDIPTACDGINDGHSGDRLSCTPTRGGIEADVLPGSLEFHSTFTMRAKRNDAYVCYLITAGHAGSAAGVGNPNWLTDQDFYHGGNFIGTSSVNSLALNSPNSDSRRVPTSCDSTMSNRLYMNNANRSFPITGIRNWSAQLDGMTVCKSGVGTGVDSDGSPTWGFLCGTIVDDNTTFTQEVNGTIKVIHWAIQGDFNLNTSAADGISGGDSGAPVFSSGLLYGAASTGTGKYSTSDKIQNDLSVLFCVNSDCSLP